MIRHAVILTSFGVKKKTGTIIIDSETEKLTTFGFERGFDFGELHELNVESW